MCIGTHHFIFLYLRFVTHLLVEVDQMVLRPLQALTPVSLWIRIITRLFQLSITEFQLQPEKRGTYCLK